MKSKILLIVLVVMTFAMGCSSAPEVNTVSVAVLPVLDVLPLHVAQAQGYFEDEGLEVDLVPVSSAPERDTLMQSGQVDAILNEIVSNSFL